MNLPLVLNFRMPWILIMSLGIVFSSCKKDPPIDEPPGTQTPYNLQIPPGWPEMEIPLDNPMTVEGVKLGRRLYYDDVLSTNGLSCSFCHNQEQAFTIPALGPNGHTIPPHVNVGWKDNYGWLGEEDLLDHVPLADLAPGNIFLNANSDSIRNRFLRDPVYLALFEDAFSIDITSVSLEERNTFISQALAQFIRTLISGNSKYDKFKRGEPGGDFTQNEFNGYVMFFTEKGDCFHCHTLPFYRDNGFHNIGLDSVFFGPDEGRFLFTGNPADIGKFATPTLRNIGLTAPYMHDGRFATLGEVIDHYNLAVKQSPTLDPIMSKPNHVLGLNLTAQEKTDLIAFLHTLTDTTFTTNPELASPF